MKNTSSLHRLGLVALAVSALSACGTARLADTAAAPAPAPSTQAPAPAAAPAAADNVLVFAVPQANGSTAQGGQLEAFAYSEKPGDATLEKLAVVGNVARVTGTVWPQKGSTWAGVGYTAPAGGADKTVDLSAHKTLRIQLASATAKQLRVRVLGTDKATRDAGCYPVVVLPVSAELREHEVALAAFAPEGYCGPNGRAIAATSKAAAAIEVSDPALVAGTRRVVDFQVGRMYLKP